MVCRSPNGPRLTKCKIFRHLRRRQETVGEKRPPECKIYRHARRAGSADVRGFKAGIQPA